MVLWQKFIDNIAPDGFVGNKDDYRKNKEMLRSVVFLALTDQVHPVVALRTAFENFDVLELLYNGDISGKMFVERLSKSGKEPVLSDDEDPGLLSKYSVLFHGLICASSIMQYYWGMEYNQVVNEFAKYDIWADIACNGRKMCMANPWDIGDSLVRFMYGDDGYDYARWDDIYPQLG